MFRRLLIAAFIVCGFFAFGQSAWAQFGPPVYVAQPSGGGSPFAQDNFSGTGGTLLSAHTDSLGNSWTRADNGNSGDINISSNFAVQTNTSTANPSAVYFDNGSPPSANYTVSANIQVADQANGTGLQAYVLARGAGSGATANRYICGWNGSTTTWRLAKVVGGTTTNLTTSATPALVLATNFAVALTVSGNSISCTINGTTTLGPITDSSVTAAGKSGIYEGTFVSAGGTSQCLHEACVSSFKAQ